MPRIALVFGSFRGGGVARVMLRLAGALVDRGADVHLVVGRTTGDLAGEVPHGVTVHPLDGGSAVGTYVRILRADPPAGLHLLRRAATGMATRAATTTSKLRYLQSLSQIFSRLRPDAVLAATAPFNLISLWAASLAGIPARIVVSEHNILTRPDKGEANWRYGLPPTLLHQVYPRASAIVGVSAGVAGELCSLAGLAAERVTVVHNPVFDASLTAKAAETVDHPWFGDGAPPVIIGVGKVYAPGKDFPNLVRAFARLRRERPCRLIILGDTSGAAKDDRQLSEVMSLPDQLGVGADVCFPGFIANPFAWMRRASVFALSSAWEGLPLVLIEAMATGCPVVSTDCPHGPREILDGGRYGPLVPVGDDSALAAAIATTLDTPPSAERMRRRAADFSVERSIEGYLRLILPPSAAVAS